MIPGTELASWLADRAAQDRSFDRVQASAGKWGGAPLMAQLERELIETEDHSPEMLLDAARRFMDRTGEIDGLVEEMIVSCRADPFFRPPFHSLSSEVHHGLVLYHHPDLSISLGVTGVDQLAKKRSSRTGPASINFTGLVTMFRFIKAGGAILSFWESDPITPIFSAAQAGPCRLKERRRIEDGEEVVIDGRHQSFVIDHAQSDLVYFQAAARMTSAPVATEYDSDTLQFIGASSTDEPSSRLQMMVSLLRALGREDAFPLFEEALSSPHFYTRWHVMREMLAMDADAAHPALKRMAEADPHPDIREAARRTLDMFFEELPEAPPTGKETACRG